jgi:prepilin-type N-terminal cleavage/methylation domain-containing protein
MKNLKISKKKGFSLVELLVVIAVIGVIAAIAIPAMTGIFENSRSAKARRNAQNIASTYAAARAAGATFTGSTTAALVADQLNVGITGQGQFSTTTFQVPLSATERTAAAALLSGPGVAGGNLIYNASEQ